MASVAIPMVYSPKHREHAPRKEYFHGRVLHTPEVPARANMIYSHLTASGLVQVIEPEAPVVLDEIIKVHDAGMVKCLQHISQHLEDYLYDPAQNYKLTVDGNYYYPLVFPSRSHMHRLHHSPMGRAGYYFFDTAAPVGVGTWEAALHSATVAYEGANQLLQHHLPVAYALCRPPGHHAGSDFMGGYCYLNNAAIAANHLLEMGKVALIDIDYHHGNGTQEIFWDNPAVFFASIHADPRHEYPYYSGYEDETGGIYAKNTSFNIPLPLQSDGNVYLSALKRVLEAVTHFQPAAVVISAGVDTYAEDPLGAFKLIHEDYYAIGEQIARLNLPTLFVQEGGYNVETTGALVEQLLSGFLGIQPAQEQSIRAANA